YGDRSTASDKSATSRGDVMGCGAVEGGSQSAQSANDQARGGPRDFSGSCDTILERREAQGAANSMLGEGVIPASPPPRPRRLPCIDVFQGGSFTYLRLPVVAGRRTVLRLLGAPSGDRGSPSGMGGKIRPSNELFPAK
ncbi:hypothetical protein THAOC_00749, partial [Thalassiosira oceanica]